MHNFFARIAPRGAAFTAWNKLTQVGKVAWFWRAWNERAIDEFGQLPDDCYRVVRIEDFDYEKYAELGHFMGFEPQVGQAQFDSLRASKPHAFLRKRNIDDWTEQEIVEFEQAVGPLAERLGYPYRIADLLSSPSRRPVTLGGPDVNKRAEGPRFWRLRRAAAKLLHNLAEGLDAK
jgi:hypothetical protein